MNPIMQQLEAYFERLPMLPVLVLALAWAWEKYGPGQQDADKVPSFKSKGGS